MRILHTSDWHLGHALHDLPRDYEHARFLSWLLDTIEAEAADAVVITGDVFDSANPPASAQDRWYGFLADAHRRFPDLEVVVIGGNHDSAARLNAPARVLRSLRTCVVGGLSRRDDGSIDTDKTVIPLHDRNGDIAAWVAAVPFLRAADLPREVGGGATGDPLIEGVRQVYAEVIAAARARREPGQALVATGHLYMVSTKLSLVSERRILGGNQHALPADIFDDDIAYVALGHLHKAQRVGKSERVRYAGSPIPLAMNEANYRHQVCVACIDGDLVSDVRTLVVPRSVELRRIPARGSVTLEDLVPMLQALEDDADDAVAQTRPYLELCVALPKPEPTLRRQVDELLAGKRARLVRLEVEYTGDGDSLADAARGRDLKEMDPHEVFLRRYRRDHEQDPDPMLLEAFHELLDRVMQERR